MISENQSVCAVVELQVKVINVARRVSASLRGIVEDADLTGVGDPLRREIDEVVLVRGAAWADIARVLAGTGSNIGEDTTGRNRATAARCGVVCSDRLASRGSCRKGPANVGIAGYLRRR